MHAGPNCVVLHLRSSLHLVMLLLLVVLVVQRGCNALLARTTGLMTYSLCRRVHLHLVQAVLLEV
jgi:hypothetical protein